jgi:hypothetical protein
MTLLASAAVGWTIIAITSSLALAAYVGSLSRRAISALLQIYVSILVRS